MWRRTLAPGLAAMRSSDAPSPVRSSPPSCRRDAAVPLVEDWGCETVVERFRCEVALTLDLAPLGQSLSAAHPVPVLFSIPKLLSDEATATRRGR